MNNIEQEQQLSDYGDELMDKARQLRKEGETRAAQELEAAASRIADILGLI